MFSVAIVGLGHIARHQIAAIGQSEAFRLVAACDPEESTRSLLDNAVAYYPDIDALLAHPGIDVVAIASPNRMHVDHGIRVSAAGYWLLIEKPVAETRAEYDRFLAALQCREAGCTVALHAAFGAELKWFCSNLDRLQIDLRELEFLYGQFYDPYFHDGRLQARAESLGGSWLDSGINALSVSQRLIDLDAVRVCDSRMTRVAGSGCSEVQASVELEFQAGARQGFGLLDTNWTLGRDSKKTTLAFANGRKIVIDHSAQQVIEKKESGDELLYSCDNDLPRLTNHYVGVFADLERQMKSAMGNLALSNKLHRLFFDAAAPSAP